MHSHEALSRALVTERSPSSALPAPASPGSAAGRRAPPADPPAGRMWPRLTSDRRAICSPGVAPHYVPGARTPDPLDASFLHTETATAHMHVAWKGRFRPAPGAPPITLARVVAQVASRLGGAPRSRMRLAFPAGGFAGPVWVDAEGFDLRRHVMALGGRDEVLARSEFDARADAALSRRWTARIRCGRSTCAAARGRQRGLVMKIHHAMVDGKSALAVALLLLDLDPNAPEPAPPSGVDRRPGAGARSAGGRSAGRVGSGAAARAGASGARGGLPSSARRDAAAGGAVGRGGRGAVGAVVVPQPRDRAAADAGRAHRGVERLLDVKRAWGGSLNDVALAVVAGALRQLALLRRWRRHRSR